MKLTEELKQKIDAYFESKSEEEVYEILKGYGLKEENNTKYHSLFADKLSGEDLKKLFKGFETVNIKDFNEFSSNETMTVKRVITLYSYPIKVEQ